VRLIAAKLRTKKSFLRGGPSLYLFVVSLRCDHSCHYCQVSRQSPDRSRYDMSSDTARHAVTRIFESPSSILTVEFQGGEPLLAFPIIKQVVEDIVARNVREGRSITFTVTSTLHHATDDVLSFLKTHNFAVSTSIDGPASIHNANRANPTRDAHERTVASLQRAKEILGADRLAALTTLTRASLSMPEAIIDEYVRLGFRSIFLRPVSPYGFAVRAKRRIGYDVDEFLTFYQRALRYIIELNKRGIILEEAFATTLLTHILTPFPSNYTDLRSPAGAGLGVLVYNYDGSVYASDEGRMLAEMGDQTFRLGAVTASYADLMRSTAMQLLLATGVAESLPGCSDCAFLPFCGADPVHSLAKEGDPIGHRAFSDHCHRHMGLFELLFRYLADADPDVMRIFLAWVQKRSPNEFKRDAH
jgi:His-Xaa-Ser system radical SAM maturase HxsB